MDAGEARRSAALVGWPSYPPKAMIISGDMIRKRDGYYVLRVLEWTPKVRHG